jgi:excisionase family DNA binding protein
MARPRKPPVDPTADPALRDRQLVTVAQVAAVTGTSPDSVKKWIAEGKLPAIMLGPSTLRIRITDVDKLIDGLITSGGNA